MSNRLRPEFDMRPTDFASHTLTTQTRTLKKSQTLATNKAEHRSYEIAKATDRDYSQSATTK